ncbi:MAG: hypothetical protein K9H25_18180 [Rhodospirillum sp.]|nr:hypothetical protein [Rhodospirillum sp.]MCF8490826.1 hypothetical protein [Rhodospirillum sp.]MCF8501385.1 hypothetical protein [Rhodospirillum sp.]
MPFRLFLSIPALSISALSIPALSIPALAALVLTSALLVGCAAPRSGSSEPSDVSEPVAPQALGRAVTGRVTLAPESLGWPKGTARMVLPAARVGDRDRVVGLLVVSGEVAGSKTLAPYDGMVVVDGKGKVLIDHAAAVEWDKDMFIARGSKRDVQELVDRAVSEGASVFQAPLLLDGGRDLSGPGVEVGPARRLTLYRDGTGRLGVLDSGQRRPTLRGHLDELATLGATEAVALDPSGLSGIVWTLNGAGPLGERVGGYLTLEWAR